MSHLVALDFSSLHSTVWRISSPYGFKEKEQMSRVDRHFLNQ
jgi:hypothetical protein